MPYKWRVMIAVGLATYMATMDSSIVTIALPTFSRVFHASPNTVLWLSLGVMLTTTGLTLTLGRLGDLLGRRRIYLAGLVIFTAGLGVAGLAQSFPQLLAVRIVQACGGAMVLANGTAIVTAAFPAHERGRALGINSAIVGAGLMSGPVVGGVLLESLDWPALFYMRIPVGMLALAASWRILEDTPPAHVGERRLDIAGAAALFATLSTLLLAVNRGQAWGWRSPAILGLFALAAVSLPVFLRIESRAPSPVVALSLFRDRLLVASLLSQVLNFVAQAAVTLVMPFYLIYVLGYSPARAGLVLISVPLLMLLLSPFAGALSDRVGSRLLATVGVVLVSLGLLSLATLGTDTPAPLVMIRLTLIGAGTALFGPPNNSTVMGRVPPSMLGTGASMIATGRNVGQSVGLAMAGAVFTAVAASHAGVSAAAARPDHLPPDAVLAGVRAAFAVSTAISLGAVTASFFRTGGTLAPTEDVRPSGRVSPPLGQRSLRVGTGGTEPPLTPSPSPTRGEGSTGGA